MKKQVKRRLSLLLTLCMAASLFVIVAAEEETVIHLSDTEITVDGTTISQNTADGVYLEMKNETHEDVPADFKDLENKVITISKAGTYRFGGTISDAQIAVRAGESDEVTIILDGIDITCRTAPAILVSSAKETNEVGKSGVTLYLEDGSENTVTGSHTVKLTDDDVKYDAAISSAVSLTVDGSGSLNLISDNEGLEVKNKHLTINNGNIHIDSCDDPINGSDDYVAHITINGGRIFGSSARGKEGDGIDSNGYITINGGTVIFLGNPNSADGGLDSELGTTINGGTVVAAGNMYDPLENTGEQLFMYLQFADSTEDIVCITDKDGNPIFAYDFPYNYSYISFSTPALTEGIYRVSLGGEIQGTEKDGLYTEITSYSGGTTMYHGGGTAQMMGPGGMGGRPEGMTPPEGMEFPEGMERPQRPESMEFPEGMERPQRPEGMEFPEGMERPQRPEGMEFPEGMTPPEGMERPQSGGGRRPGGMQNSADTATSDFMISRENNSYTNVTSTRTTRQFTDVPTDSWFYAPVEAAAQKGWLKGVGDNRFSPEAAITGAEWMTILARMADVDTESGETWYDNAVAWGSEKQILHRGGWSFDANTPLTREQMADMIWGFAKAMDMDTSATNDTSSFTDSDRISDFAKEAFSWATAIGVLQGDGNALYPLDNLTRAEAAQVIQNLTKALEQNAISVTAYPVVVDEALYTTFSESADGYFSKGFQTGFGSGVTFKGYDENGNMQFYGVTDRGPSPDAPQVEGVTTDSSKIFPSPDFTPSIGIITVKDGNAVIEEAITLKNADGEPLSGLPLPEGTVGSTGEMPLDMKLEALACDENGFDPEGIALDADGNFWLADEYGPFIAKFDKDGVMQQLYAPGDGLPEILKHRIANRGFEGITIAPNGKVYATVQSVLDVEGETAKTATFIRIVELDPETGDTKMYAYPVALEEYSSPKNCKLGDVYAADNNTLLIVEQGKLADGSMRTIIYQADLTNATDISDLSYEDKALEYASAEQLSSIMSYAKKEIYVNLRDHGWTAEKAEGLCLTDKGTLAIMIEDDFGIAGSELAEGKDTVTLLPIADGDAAQMWLLKRD